MKSQLTAVLFSLVLAACGGDKSNPPIERSEPLISKSDELPMPVVEPPPKRDVVEVVEPVEVELPKTYAAALALGKELIAKGEHPRGREILELAAKLDKKIAEPHIELARSFITTNERAHAIRSANKAVKLAPESSLAYNTLGRAELLRHNYDNAIIAFRQATELNADNVWAWNNLGFTYLTLKNYEDAIDALAEATSRKGATGYMWNNLGTAHEHLDQLDEAREAFEKGGELGSVAAASSRKRLEGVDTIVVIHTETPRLDELGEPRVDDDVKGAGGIGYAEPMPDDVEDSADVDVEPPAEVVDDEPVDDETPAVVPAVL